jgi:hypothetical protein
MNLENIGVIRRLPPPRDCHVREDGIISAFAEAGKAPRLHWTASLGGRAAMRGLPASAWLV